MSDRVLVAFASNYGSTREVAEAVAARLNERAIEAEFRPLTEARAVEGFGAVVIGAPLVMHHWHKDALRFLSRNRQVLTQMPVAVFALGPVHDPRDEAEWQDSRAQFDQELARFPWLNPRTIEILGGKFDPALLQFPLNKLAGSAPASDARDWEAIAAWADTLPSVLQAPA